MPHLGNSSMAQMQRGQQQQQPNMPYMKQQQHQQHQQKRGQQQAQQPQQGSGASDGILKGISEDNFGRPGPASAGGTSPAVAKRAGPPQAAKDAAAYNPTPIQRPQGTTPSDDK